MCSSFHFLDSHVFPSRVPPCVLPSVASCFHVFTILFLGPYITCIVFYHVLQSDNQLGSVLSHLLDSPLSSLVPAPTRRTITFRLVRQAPRPVGILLGNLCVPTSSLRLARVQQPNSHVRRHASP
jgi:hypothetical protein